MAQASSEVGHSFGVSLEHRDEREPVMSQPHGLGALEVGVARKHGVAVLARALCEDLPQFEQSPL